MLWPAACAASPPLRRAASSARISSATLAALPTVSGGIADRADPVRGLAGQRDDPGPAAALAGGRRGRLRRRQQPGLAQVGGVRVAGRLALHDPDAGAPVAPGRHLLDLAVVQVGRRRALVLDVYLGEVRAGPQARAEHPLDEVAVDQVGPGARFRRVVGHAAEPTEPRAPSRFVQTDAVGRPEPSERRGRRAGAEAPPEPPPADDPAPPVVSQRMGRPQAVERAPSEAAGGRRDRIRAAGRTR